MRQNTANMDNHFRERLNNYSAKAPRDAWDQIELKLDQRNAPKRKIGIWYMAAASIAVIALSATLFTLLHRNDQLIDQQFIAIEREAINAKTDKKQENILPTNESLISNKIITTHTNFLINNDKKGNAEKRIEERYEKNSQNELTVEKLIPVKPQFYYKPSHLQLNPPNVSFIAQRSINNDSKNKKSKTNDKLIKSDRWSVGFDFGPSYSYRYLSSSSNNKENVAYFNAVENPVQTYTGGINIKYKLLNRLMVQSGIYYAKMGQSIGNLIVYENKSYDSSTDSYLKNLKNSYTITNSIGDINVNSNYIVFDNTNFRVDFNTGNSFFFDKTDESLNPLDANVIQNFEYLDIPLIFRYKLIDRKIDLTMVTGAGLSFLLGNEVSLVINDSETIFGKTQNVREINYTANIGIALEIPVKNNLKFSLEPNFKYHLNKSNLEGDLDWHPYSFALISGFCLSL